MREAHGVGTNSRSLKEFLVRKNIFVWKEAEEYSNHVYFSKQHGDSFVVDFRYAYFNCQHDGPRKDWEHSPFFAPAKLGIAFMISSYY